MTTTSVGSHPRSTTHPSLGGSRQRLELTRERLQLAFWTLGMMLAAVALIVMLAQHVFMLGSGARVGGADVAIAIAFATAARGSSRRQGQS